MAPRASADLHDFAVAMCVVMGVRNDDVVAAAAVDHVAAPVPNMDPVRALSRPHVVSPVTDRGERWTERRQDPIRAWAADKVIASEVALQPIIPASSVEEVVPVLTAEEVITSEAAQKVAPRSAVQVIVALVPTALRPTVSVASDQARLSPWSFVAVTNTRTVLKTSSSVRTYVGSFAPGMSWHGPKPLQ